MNSTRTASQCPPDPQTRQRRPEAQEDRDPGQAQGGCRLLEQPAPLDSPWVESWGSGAPRRVPTAQAAPPPAGAVGKVQAVVGVMQGWATRTPCLACDCPLHTRGAWGLIHLVCLGLSWTLPPAGCGCAS